MKVIATIEARMTSKRLPGKVMLFASGKSMLEHLVNRIRKVPSIDEIVLATTINSADDVLVEFANKVGVRYYRGSEDDVMQRVIDAAKSVDADIVVELTGDNPLIDPLIIEMSIQYFKANNADYLFSSNYPIGMNTQVFYLAALVRSANLTDAALDHEHVTLHIRNNPEIFSQVQLLASPEMNWPDLGLTLDEPKDYELLKKIIQHFDNSNIDFSCIDIVRLLRNKPDWVSINKAVVRKGDS
jgi:spore coat polysaccharide biosynthesis protein SpsF